MSLLEELVRGRLDRAARGREDEWRSRPAPVRVEEVAEGAVSAMRGLFYEDALGEPDGEVEDVA